MPLNKSFLIVYSAFIEKKLVLAEKKYLWKKYQYQKMYLSWKLYKVTLWPKPHMQSSVYTEPLTFKYFVRGWRDVLILTENVKELKFGRDWEKAFGKN